MRTSQADLNSLHVLRAHRPRPTDTQHPSRAGAHAYYVDTQDLPTQKTWLQRHLFHIGVGMLLMLTGFYLVTTYVVPFVQNQVNHWTCGEDLICQYDLDVGHGGTSHFLTEYWHAQVIIIEMQHGDPTKTKMYVQTITASNDATGKHLISLQTAYLSFHPLQGKPDLVASITGFALPVIFYNTGSRFSTEEPK